MPPAIGDPDSKVLKTVSQQKSPHEDMILFVVTVLLIFGLCWIIWHFFSLELTALYRWIRVAELNIVKLLFGDDTVVVHAAVGEQTTGAWRNYLRHVNVRNITQKDFEVSTYITMMPLRYVFAGVLLLTAMYVMMKGPGTSYKRRLNLETLMQEQAKSFPTIAPFLKFDPRDVPFRAPGQPVPAELPLFSEALTPEEWVAYHEISYQGARLDPQKTYQALTLQLGKRWQGINKLPIHSQGLFAAFALKHVRKRKDSDDLLNQMALAWSPEKGFQPSPKLKKRIQQVNKDPKIGGVLLPYADQHAYETTALLRCLMRARSEGGVIAPATFVWLRGHDRNLWYPLNNLGRRSYHAEAAGAMVHYTNELIAGQKIPTPRFDTTIKGIEEYLKSGAGRVIPELDRTKRGFKYKRKKK